MVVGCVGEYFGGGYLVKDYFVEFVGLFIDFCLGCIGVGYDLLCD